MHNVKERKESERVCEKSKELEEINNNLLKYFVEDRLWKPVEKQ